MPFIYGLHSQWIQCATEMWPGSRIVMQCAIRTSHNFHTSDSRRSIPRWCTKCNQSLHNLFYIIEYHLASRINAKYHKVKKKLIAGSEENPADLFSQGNWCTTKLSICCSWLLSGLEIIWIKLPDVLLPENLKRNRVVRSHCQSITLNHYCIQ